MIKKIMTLMAVAMVGISTLAQSINAGWYRFPVFNDAIDNIIETPDKVYYRSATNLFSFSPADNESYVYSPMNKLSDTDIKEIYYNNDKGYLLVVYTSTNMDMIYDDGRVVNLPEIKDAVVTMNKSINDVAFGNDRIAVATSFGIVIYDDDKWEVVESGIYNTGVDYIAIAGDNLLIYRNFNLYHSPLADRHNTLDKFKAIGSGCNLLSLQAIDSNKVLYKEKTKGYLMTRVIDFEKSDWQPIVTSTLVNTMPVFRYNDGYATCTSNAIVTIDKDGQITSKTIAAPVAGQKVAFLKGTDKVWAGNKDGIAQYDLSGAAPEVVVDKMKVADVTTCQSVALMRWSNDGDRLYITNQATTGFKSIPNANNEGTELYQTTNIVEGFNVKDVSLMEASVTHSQTKSIQNKKGSKRLYGGANWVVEDPDDPDKYYVGVNFEGVMVVKDGKQIGKFDATNSNIEDNWGARVQFIDIDREGNLWTLHKGSAEYCTVLPAASRKKDPSEISKDEWIKGNFKVTALNNRDIIAVLSKKSDVFFFASGQYGNGFSAVDTKGTLTDFSDDVKLRWPAGTGVIDQDGNSFTYSRAVCMVEDQRGHIWIGTNTGIFEITEPSTAVTPSLRVRRPKVPRNDGTNYADFLLDGEQINWIAVDASDRKWIATENSGVYLVSEDGDQIMEHFTVDNSPLPTNLVLSVSCDPKSNRVFIGTNNGLYCYEGSSAPAQADLSDIYAYPNPVRPEYTGWITITGLMDNSLVKITDSAGQVFFQTTSEGGMVRWDGCNQAGQRVKSGVYYVYASSNSSGSNTGAVTKIVVIN